MSQAFDTAKEAFNELFEANHVNVQKISELERTNSDMRQKFDLMKKGE